MMINYEENTFIENVIIDKFNNNITSYTKVYDILEIIFEHAKKDEIDVIKSNILGYEYRYENSVIGSCYHICKKTYFDIGRILKYQEYDISCMISEYLLECKGISIRATMDINSSCDEMDELITYYYNKYTTEKRIFNEVFFTKDGEEYEMTIVDMTIQNEIDINLYFILNAYRENSYAIIDDISKLDEYKKDMI